MKDNVKLLAQVIMLIGGTWLTKHGMDNSGLEEAVGALMTLAATIWKFVHWNTTPDAGSATGQNAKPMGGAVHLLLIGALLIGVGAPLTGCKNPQQAAYRTAGTTAVSVDTSLHLWNAYVKSGKATLDQERQVKAAFEKYQTAMLVVCDAGAIYSAAAQTNAAGASGYQLALQQAILNAGQSIGDLQTLITSFGVKL